MRISLVLLIVTLVGVIGYGIAMSRASAWGMLAVCIFVVVSFQIGYLAGAFHLNHIDVSDSGAASSATRHPTLPRR